MHVGVVGWGAATGVQAGPRSSLEPWLTPWSPRAIASRHRPSLEELANPARRPRAGDSQGQEVGHKQGDQPLLLRGRLSGPLSHSLVFGFWETVAGDRSPGPRPWHCG